MLIALVLGFLAGSLVLVAIEGAVILWALYWLRRKKAAATLEAPRDPPPRGLEGDRRLNFPLSKKGIVWILEQEKVPKASIQESSTEVCKGQNNKKNVFKVLPTKKYAEIEDHSLILSNSDGSKVTIQLVNCTVVAVSASNLSSRKWAKRYPIKLESKDFFAHSGSRTMYMYLETSWEKESWCNALRLASCLDKGRRQWYTQLDEDFNNYLASLHAEYPSFLKPVMYSSEAVEKAYNSDRSSRVQNFLKKLSKKALKRVLEGRQLWTSSSIQGKRKVGDETHTSCDVPSSDFTRSSSKDMSSSNTLRDMVQPTKSYLSHLDKGLSHNFPEAAHSEKFVNDEGRLCWNLLFSRLFFDARKSIEINNRLKAWIQRTLSNMRIPNYIGEVTCTGLDLGNIQPYVHRMRVLPLDTNRVCTIEVDIEYSGGILLDIEARLEVRESQLQKDMVETSLEPSTTGEANWDLLFGIEHSGSQLKSSSYLAGGMDDRNKVDKRGEQLRKITCIGGQNIVIFSVNSSEQNGKDYILVNTLPMVVELEDGLTQSRSGCQTSGQGSRWKTVLHSIADQVSQVPFSLTIRAASLRGTLRLQIKSPPSDRPWFGFTKMPEIDWNLEPSVGDHKINSSCIAVLIGNRLKAAIREKLVLPNCESIWIPWMLGEKDDWIPRKAAPFIWINRIHSKDRI